MNLRFKKSLAKAICYLNFLAWIILGSNTIQMLKVIPHAKYIKVKIPIEDLVRGKKLQNHSFTRLTCAALAQATGEDAYYFDEIEHVCQMIAEIPFIDPFNSAEMTLATKDTIDIRINENKLTLDLFVGLIQPINNTAMEMLPFVALLSNGNECLVESIPIPPEEKLHLAYNTVDESLYYCCGEMFNGPYRVGCYHLDLTKRTQGWKILNSSAIDPTSNRKDCVSLSFIDDQMYIISREMINEKKKRYKFSILKYNLTAKVGWTQIGSSWGRNTKREPTHRFMGRFVLELVRSFSKITSHLLIELTSNGIEEFKPKKNGPIYMGHREPAKVSLGEGNEGYLFHTESSKRENYRGQIYIFTLNETKPQESKWTIVSNSTPQCIRCQFFNLGRDNILAIGINNKAVTKFNWVKGQLDMKRNTTLLKTRNMISTTIPLKYVINDCKKHF